MMVMVVGWSAVLVVVPCSPVLVYMTNGIEVFCGTFTSYRLMVVSIRFGK